jgi:hypothetical protein
MHAFHAGFGTICSLRARAAAAGTRTGAPARATTKTIKTA